MWLMLDTGFVSVVQHKDDPEVLLVRARAAGDIESIFGSDVTVAVEPGADYLYRAEIGRTRVAEVLLKKVLALDYTSHAKDVALQRSPANPLRREAYYETWQAMALMQPYAPYTTVPRTESSVLARAWRRHHPILDEEWFDEDYNEEAAAFQDFRLEDDGQGGVRTVT